MTSPSLLRRALEVLSDREGRSQQRQLQSLSAQGAGHVTAWVHGAIRQRRTLGAVLGSVAKRALKGKPPRVVATLELFAFRILYGGERLEDFQADLGRVCESKKVASHVERVLEALSRAIGERAAWSAEAETRDDLLPISREEVVRFRKPLLGVAQRGPGGRLALLYSLPQDLVETWVDVHGEAQAAELCRAANDSAPLFARACALRITLAELIERLASAGVSASLADPAAPGSLVLGEGRGLFRHSEVWAAGTFLIQDLTAQRVAPLLAPQPGERIVDLCAAPGGKTTHLAELSQDQATILACDLQGARLRRVEENAERLGLTSITTRRLDALKAAAELESEAPFDGVLLDAPCSNTGVLRRRSEARWRYDAGSQRRIHATQAALLRGALPLLRPGGRLVYSLCSIERSEGSAQVEALCAERSDLRLEREELWFPTPGGGDGGYAALLRLE